MRTAGGVVQEVSYSGSVPQPDRRAPLPAGRAARARGRGPRAAAAERPAEPRTSPTSPRSCSSCSRPRGSGRSDERRRARGRRGCSSLGGCWLAPLLRRPRPVGKARLQGRRGAGPLQPYRELRRLWGKSTVDGRGHERRLPLAPAGRGGERGRRRAARPGRGGGARLGRRPRRARARRACSRWRASPLRPPRGTWRTASR